MSCFSHQQRPDVFLANENFPAPSVSLLRQQGFEVHSIVEENRGLDDISVIGLAREHGLVILTFDRDYGEIICRGPMDNPPSVVFFRTKGQQPQDAGKMLLNLIKKGQLRLLGAFTVITDIGIRQRIYG